MNLNDIVEVTEAYEASESAALSCIKDCHNTFENRYHVAGANGQDVVALAVAEVEEKLRRLLDWIPVSERLPNRVEAQGVAFIWEWNGYAQFGAGAFNDGRFWLDNGDGYSEAKATHWIALPKVLYDQHKVARLFVFED